MILDIMLTLKSNCPSIWEFFVLDSSCHDKKYAHLVKCEMYRNSSFSALLILRCQQLFKSFHLEKSMKNDRQNSSIVLLISITDITRFLIVRHIIYHNCFSMKNLNIFPFPCSPFSQCSKTKAKKQKKTPKKQVMI